MVKDLWSAYFVRELLHKHISVVAFLLEGFFHGEFVVAFFLKGFLQDFDLLLLELKCVVVHFLVLFRGFR